MLKGIDVSKHQGVIDWAKVKASGLADFVMIRAGYGMYTSQADSRFEANVKGVEQQGIPYGLYWYSYADSSASAIKEAETCLEVIKDCNPELPIFFDIEYEPDILKMNNAERTNCCNVFCSTIKKARSNNMVGVYASKDFLENKLNVKNLDNGLQIWVAQYVSDNKISNPGKSSYKGEHQIWQYTSKGKVNGISGNVDLNFGYADYSAKKLKKWIKTSRGWIYGDYKNRWLKQDDRWYWFNQEGIAVTGWQKVKGTDYYFADKEFADQSKGIVKECQCMEPTKD